MRGAQSTELRRVGLVKAALVNFEDGCGSDIDSGLHNVCENIAKPPPLSLGVAPPGGSSKLLGAAGQSSAPSLTNAPLQQGCCGRSLLMSTEG